MTAQVLTHMRAVTRWFLRALIVSLLLASTGTSFWENVGNLYVARLSLSRNVDQRVQLEWKAFAESLYERVVPLTLEQSAVWMWLAEASAAAGDWEGASDRYHQLVSLGGDRQRAFDRLRALAFYQGWCKSDGQQLVVAAQQISSVAESYRLWADACVNVDDLDLAIAAHRHMVQIDPSYANVVLLASALMQDAEKAKSSLPERATSDYAEIVQLLQQVHAEGPYAALGYYLLAWSYWQLNQFDKAIASYDSCLGRNSSGRVAFTCALHLGYAYSQWLPQERRDFNKALAYYQQAEKADPSQVNLLELKLAEGGAWLQLGSSERALMLFRDAIRLQPTCVECALSAGDALVALGRDSEAKQQFRDVLRRFPGNERAVTALEKLEGQH